MTFMMPSHSKSGWRKWIHRKAEDSGASFGAPLKLEALRPGQIRLLTIDQPGRKLSGRLSTYTLETAPKYFAVSYAWSHVPASAVMSCNGAPLHLTLELKNSLTILSNNVGAGSRFWVDAICIAQDNAQEKAEQVQQIHQVFQKASDVLVWLGSSANKSNMLISKVPALLKSLENAKQWDFPTSKPGEVLSFYRFPSQ